MIGRESCSHPLGTDCLEELFFNAVPQSEYGVSQIHLLLISEKRLNM